MRTRTILLSLLILITLSAARADEIVLKKEFGGEKIKCEIYKEDDKYSGKIVWSKHMVYPEGDPDAGKAVHDRENPDPAKRDQPIIGLVIVKGLKYAGKGRWSRGTIYDPEVGKTYKVKVSREDEDTLNIRGFIGVSLLGRTTVWTRYKEPKEEKKQ